MIDYDRFWHEPGCMPGLTKEETERQFREMAAWFKTLPGPAVTGEPDISRQPGLFPGPGATPEQIESWELERGVGFPDVLRRAYSRQDGGYLRNIQFRLLPLTEIASPHDEFWQFVSYDEDQVPERALILRFGWDEESSGSYYLNYAKGPHEEPSVFVHHSDPGDLQRTSAAVTKFFRRMLETSQTPSVDWSETARVIVIAREIINLSAIHGAQAEREQILGRLEETLVLFARDRAPGEETITKTTLPEPLDCENAHVERHRSDPAWTYGLMLQPEDSEGIVHHESQRTPDGEWKNSILHGAPVYVTFESTDRNRLLELRQALSGEKAAARAGRQDRELQELQQTMQSLPPEQLKAAGMTMFATMRERLHADHPLDLSKMPPEAVDAYEAIQGKLRDAERSAREALAAMQLNPEIQRLMRKINEPGSPGTG